MFCVYILVFCVSINTFRKKMLERRVRQSEPPASVELFLTGCMAKSNYMRKTCPRWANRDLELTLGPCLLRVPCFFRNMTGEVHAALSRRFTSSDSKITYEAFWVFNMSTHSRFHWIIRRNTWKALEKSQYYLSICLVLPDSHKTRNVSPWKIVSE